MLADCSLRSQVLCLPAAPMLDALAAGVRECRSKAFVGDKLQLDAFLDGMLRSRYVILPSAERLSRAHSLICA